MRKRLKVISIYARRDRHDYAYHLTTGRLHALLLDPHWLQAKLDATHVDTLINYCDRLPPGDEPIRLLRAALSDSAHVLGEDKTQLGSQLVGRLMLWRAEHPVLRTLTDALAATLPGLYPVDLDSPYPSLLPSGGAIPRDMPRHNDEVTHIALTPDGATAVSASWDNTLIVWDVATGMARHTLIGHTAGIWRVALTPDGTTAISASADRTLIVWDIASGAVRRTFTEHKSPVNRVAVTPDGATAISATSKRLIVWDIASGLVRHVLTACKPSIYHIAVTPDGATAVSVSGDFNSTGEVIIWDIASGMARSHTLIGNRKRVHCVAVTRDGATAVSAAGELFSAGKVIVWDLATGLARHTLIGHTEGVVDVAVTPDGTTAISASWRELIVWDITTGVQRMKVAETVEGRLAIADAYPDLTDFDGFIHGADGIVLAFSGTFTLRHPDGRMGSFTPDGDKLSMVVGANGVVVAGDRWGQVLFLRLLPPE